MHDAFSGPWHYPMRPAVVHNAVTACGRMLQGSSSTAVEAAAK
jgi:hypothetical protein